MRDQLKRAAQEAWDRGDRQRAYELREEASVWEEGGCKEEVERELREEASVWGEGGCKEEVEREKG